MELIGQPDDGPRMRLALLYNDEETLSTFPYARNTVQALASVDFAGGE